MKAMRAWLQVAFILGLGCAVPAMPVLACTPVINRPPPTEAELDEAARQAFQTAHDLIEVRVTRSANMVLETPGRVRVLHVYKGRVREGDTLRIEVPFTMCGMAPGIYAGERGVAYLYLQDGRYQLGRFLTLDDFARLGRLGLLHRREEGTAQSR
jgi:hypothetical protein